MWLASIGAETSLTIKKAGPLPTLSEDQWQKLQPKTGRTALPAKEVAHSAEQVLSTPKEPSPPSQVTDVDPKAPDVAPKTTDAAPKAKDATTKGKDSGQKAKGRPRYALQQMSSMQRQQCSDYMHSGCRNPLLGLSVSHPISKDAAAKGKDSGQKAKGGPRYAVLLVLLLQSSTFVLGKLCVYSLLQSFVSRWKGSAHNTHILS